MTTKFSKTQIDRLGDRLRKGNLTDADFRLLDEYRRSFGEVYEIVVRAIRERLKLEPTGRPAKSTGSIVDKLHRESIRLSQVQDIAGCRIVVSDVKEQDRIVGLLLNVFPRASIVDRRVHTSFGYRAVHVIPRISGKLIEVQVRSLLQHSWAELSERVSDVFDPAIKYGVGNNMILKILMDNSERVKQIETMEDQILVASEDRLKLRVLQQEIIDTKKELVNHLNKLILIVEGREEKKV